MTTWVRTGFVVSYPFLKKKRNSFVYSNLTGIKFFSHPHPRRVTGIYFTRTYFLIISISIN